MIPYTGPDRRDPRLAELRAALDRGDVSKYVPGTAKDVAAVGRLRLADRTVSHPLIERHRAEMSRLLMRFEIASAIASAMAEGRL